MYVVWLDDGKVIILICFALMNCCNRMNSSSKKQKLLTEEEESQVGVQSRVKIEREYRICPSKLSKREIEDLYYKTLQDNMELKKTINRQEEKIKQMSVAMRRTSRENPEQKKALFNVDKDKEKDCSISTKNVVNKQKESIFELRKENEQLADRIKQLNMKLCSAKQFLNRRPSVQSRCPKCAAAVRSNASGSRNLSSSTLPTKGSEVTVKNKSASFHQQSAQELCKNEDAKPLESTESTETGDVATKQKDVPAVSCDENKCKTLMEELRQKIGSLEGELAKTHGEYSSRITRLEQEVVELHKQNLRVRSDSAARARALQQREQDARETGRKLRDAQAQCDDLALKLSIEKSKVAELETHVKSANISSQIAKTIEGQLAKKNMSSSAAPTTSTSPVYTDQIKTSSSSPSPASGPSAHVVDIKQSSSSASPPFTPIVMSHRLSGDKIKMSPSTSRRRSVEPGDHFLKDRTKSAVIVPVMEEGKEKEDTDIEKPPLTAEGSAVKVSKKKSAKVICECNAPVKKSKSKVKCECPSEKELNLTELHSRDVTDPCLECYPTSKPENASNQPEAFAPHNISKGPEITKINARKQITPNLSPRVSTDPGALSAKNIYIPHNQQQSPGTIGPQMTSETNPEEIHEDVFSGYIDVSTSPLNSFENQNLKTITPTIYASSNYPSDDVPSKTTYQPKTVPLSEKGQANGPTVAVQLTDNITPSTELTSATVPASRQNSNVVSIATGQIGQTVPIKRVEESVYIPVHELHLATPRVSADVNNSIGNASQLNSSCKRQTSNCTTATPGGGTIEIDGIVTSTEQLSASPPISSEQPSGNAPSVTGEISFASTPGRRTSAISAATVRTATTEADSAGISPTKRRYSTMPTSRAITGKVNSMPEPSGRRRSGTPMACAMPATTEEAGSTNPGSTGRRTSAALGSTPIVTEESVSTKPGPTGRLTSGTLTAEVSTVPKESTSTMPGATVRRKSGTLVAGAIPVTTEEAGFTMPGSTERRTSTALGSTPIVTEESVSTKPGPTGRLTSGTPTAEVLTVPKETTSTMPGATGRRKSGTLMAGAIPATTEEAGFTMPGSTGRRKSAAYGFTPIVTGESVLTKPGPTERRTSGTPTTEVPTIPEDSTMPGATVRRNSKTPATGQLTASVTVGVPISTGRSSVTPTAAVQISDNSPTIAAKITDTEPKSTGQISATKPSDTGQLNATVTAAANPLNNTPMSIGQANEAILKASDEKRAASRKTRACTSSSAGQTSSSLPTSSGEDTVDTEGPQNKPKTSPRHSLQMSKDKYNSFEAQRPKVDIIGPHTASPKVSSQEQTDPLSLEESETYPKAGDKKASIDEQGQHICDTCGNPVEIEEKQPSQTPAKTPVQILPPNVLTRPFQEKVEGRRQSTLEEIESPNRRQKPLDDSGFIEPRSTPEEIQNQLLDVGDDDEQERLNKELLDKITLLQEQLDTLKIAAAGESPQKSPPLQSDVDGDGQEFYDEEKKEAPTKKKEDSYDDIVKNMNKIDEAMRHKQGVMPWGRHDGRGKLDEVNRRWVDYDLVSDDVLSDKASSFSRSLYSETRSVGKEEREDKEDRKFHNDNKYQIPGPIPTTSSPNTSKKDSKEQRTSRDVPRARRPSERSSGSFIHRESIQIGDKRKRESKDKNRNELPFMEQNKADGNISRKDPDKGTSQHGESKDKNQSESLTILQQQKADDVLSREYFDKGNDYEIASANASISKTVGIQTYGPCKANAEIDEISEYIPADYYDPTQNAAESAKEPVEVKREEVELAMCEACTQVCRCRTGVKLGAAILRSCSGTLRVQTLSGPNVKFKRCTDCSVKRVSGPTKVACPFHPQTRTEPDEPPENQPANQPKSTDQIAQSRQHRPLQVNEPDGCLDGHAQRICVDMLTRRETHDPREIKRKCGCSNEQTCKGAICRPKDGSHISDAHVLGVRANERLHRYINEKYSKSPNDTDNDYSSMAEHSYRTESPSAWHSQDSPPLSPGERQDHSVYGARRDALSDGELPADSPRGHTKLVGETQTETTYTLTTPTSSQKMTAMLQDITDELTFCRQLLQTGKPSHQLYPITQQRDASAAPVGGASQISLRKADARSRIGDAVTPKCIFTLHIGTVVLSDEAVISSAGMSLALTWRFHEQNAAMARMRAGRVVPFDFSTEYDVKLTDEFLEYLKHDEMSMLIYDVNKQDEPFALCSLPLRDALLHTNRRADMSLALVAGPRLKKSMAASDPLDPGDEVGVLDLWCMLRAEPRFLPIINRAIAKNTTVSHERSNSDGADGIMPQLDENDQDEFHLSTDLDFTHNNKPRYPSLRPADVSRLENLKANHASLNGKQECKSPGTVWRTSLPGSMTLVSRGHDDQSASHAEIPEYPMKAQVSFENTPGKSEINNSGIIVNKVPANIRSPVEMKKALEKSTITHELPPKKIIEALHTPSTLSVGSPSFWKRRSLPKQRLSLSQELDNTSNIQDLLNNGRVAGQPGVSNATQTAEESEIAFGKSKPRSEVGEELAKSDSDIYSYVSKNGTNKITDAKKAMEAFKKVKKRHYSPHAFLENNEEFEKNVYRDRIQEQIIDITVQWLALNDECEAMSNANVQRLYVAYSFLGKNGAELETPISLPKPKQYIGKCVFDFKKTFQLTDNELQALGRLARCRSSRREPPNKRDCVVFTVVSEPAEDPLAINNCEDVGYAYLYFGDLLVFSAGSDTYTEVLPIHGAQGGDVACGVLAIKVDGLDVVRKSLMT